MSNSPVEYVRKVPLPPLSRIRLLYLTAPLSEDTARQSQSSPEAAPPTGMGLTWDQISELARKPMLVERYLPRPCRALFEQVLTECFEHTPSANHPMPGTGDYVFILPKLLLSKGSDPRQTYNQKVKMISRNCQTALRGDWVALWQHAIHTQAPPFRRLGEHDAVIGEGGLSRDTARSLYAAAQRGQLGKAWKQLRTPPPMSVTSEVWTQAKEKLCPLGDDRPDLPMFATPGDWQPTLGEFKKALSKLKTGKAKLLIWEAGAQSYYSTPSVLPISEILGTNGL